MWVLFLKRILKIWETFVKEILKDEIGNCGFGEDYNFGKFVEIFKFNFNLLSVFGIAI